VTATANTTNVQCTGIYSCYDGVDCAGESSRTGSCAVACCEYPCSEVDCTAETCTTSVTTTCD
jgi:hypothetical protein